MKGVLIESVAKGSAAEKAGIEAKDTLTAANGQRILDIIDYSYYTSAETSLTLRIIKSNGKIVETRLEREEHEPLGLFFSPPEPLRCRNNCIFCFVHQLPPGLRRQLYVKDEDYRLSFLDGNYVTLANIRQKELERITRQRLSPLYISVHATNPELRERLLGREKIPPVMEQLKVLAAGGIKMHGQVVLCPGLNDGAELERTVSELAPLHPALLSLAIVPLGLTSHRRNLPELRPVDSSYAAQFVPCWERHGRKLKKMLGTDFLFLADEFYLKAGLPFPPLRSYGYLPQLENGVGMVPLFMHQAGKVLRQARNLGNFRVTVPTGFSSYEFISGFAGKLTEKCGVEIVPVKVENRLFGQSVTVTGLISGRDIVSALEGENIGKAIMIPDVMLKEGEGIFIDDMTMDELGEKLGCTALEFEASPNGFYRALSRLARRKNPRFPDRKPTVSHPEFPDGNYLS